ncbi:PAS-domain containing protein [Candidatus Aalborgicola defluviihabitans]|uniref:PAS-domain containing protein n=1 Tax=Candidatus Aalborgicola defluviihabitans TaxID=3386187 RepID=UPI00390B56EE|nr:PAS-domain containing protein [Burkholderiales bacterium]
MQQDPCQDCIEKRQLELIQRVGRVGYWEYDAQSQSMALPETSQELLHSMVGGSHDKCHSLMKVLPQAERRRLLAALDQAHAKRLAFNLEITLSNGTPKPAHMVVRGAPLTGRGGIVGIAGTFQDITQSKHIESEREEVITQMQALLDALPQGVSVIDRELKLILWNRRFFEILGLPQNMVYRYASFENLLLYNAMRGEYGPGDPQQHVKDLVDRARAFQPHRFERPQTGGRTVLVEGFPFRFGGEVSGFVTTYTDITERKQTEDQLTRQRDVMKTVIDNFPGAISLFDADLRMAACNAQFKTLLELPAQLFEKPDVHFEDLIRFNAQRGEYGPGDVETLTAASMARARNFQAHHIERARPGGTWLEVTGTVIPSGGFVTSYIDITERKQAEERIRVLALQDALTGLPNRLSLNEQLEQALQRAQANGSEFAVLFMDLDGFKKVNDQCGHDVGDALLVRVAHLLRETVRQTDVVARLGGDEFILLLHDIAGTGMVVSLADKIVASIGAPTTLNGLPVQVGASIGIAIYPQHGLTREMLLKAADQAMYVVKTHGKSGHRLAGAAE